MNLRALLVIAPVTVLLVTSCSKGPTLESLRADGYGCTLAGGGAGMIASKPNEHCFVCTDQDSMGKCSTNPLTSGCKEDPASCRKPAR